MYYFQVGMKTGNHLRMFEDKIRDQTVNINESKELKAQLTVMYWLLIKFFPELYLKC